MGGECEQDEVCLLAECKEATCGCNKQEHKCLKIMGDIEKVGHLIKIGQSTAEGAATGAAGGLAADLGGFLGFSAGACTAVGGVGGGVWGFLSAAGPILTDKGT